MTQDLMHLMTTGDVARRLYVSQRTVLNLVKRERLSPAVHTKMGMLFDPVVVENFADAYGNYPKTNLAARRKWLKMAGLLPTRPDA